MEMPEFIEARRPRWQQLELLLDKAEHKGLRFLALEEARTLGKLYRAVSSDLLWVRARSGSADVNAYLNDLVGRAYAMTYPGQRPRFSDVWSFVARGFPALLRQEWRMYVASVLLMLAGAGFGYLGMLVDPEAAPYLVPAEHLSLDPTHRAARKPWDRMRPWSSRPSSPPSSSPTTSRWPSSASPWASLWAWAPPSCSSSTG